jgi:hypothetical protein
MNHFRLNGAGSPSIGVATARRAPHEAPTQAEKRLEEYKAGVAFIVWPSVHAGAFLSAYPDDSSLELGLRLE